MSIGRLSVCVLLSPALFAHDPITTKVTWNREMSRLVFAHCGSCHREGGSAFSLMTYEEARPWAKAIKEEVLSRRMPPWNAVKGFGSFKDDRGLTQETIEIVSDWVEGGAPEGDAILKPTPPKDWNTAKAATPAGAEVTVDGQIKLTRPMELVAIRPKSLAEGSSVKMVAQQPDGAVHPLIWIYNYQPTYNRTYVLKQPLQLPAGAVIAVSPANSGAMTLIAVRPASAAVTPGSKPAR